MGGEARGRQGPGQEGPWQPGLEKCLNPGNSRSLKVCAGEWQDVPGISAGPEETRSRSSIVEEGRPGAEG